MQETPGTPSLESYLYSLNGFAKSNSEASSPAQPSKNGKNNSHKVNDIFTVIVRSRPQSPPVNIKKAPTKTSPDTYKSKLGRAFLVNQCDEESSEQAPIPKSEGVPKLPHVDIFADSPKTTDSHFPHHVSQRTINTNQLDVYDCEIASQISSTTTSRCQSYDGLLLASQGNASSDEDSFSTKHSPTQPLSRIIGLYKDFIKKMANCPINSNLDSPVQQSRRVDYLEFLVSQNRLISEEFDKVILEEKKSTSILISIEEVLKPYLINFSEPLESENNWEILKHYTEDELSDSSNPDSPNTSRERIKRKNGSRNLKSSNPISIKELKVHLIQITKIQMIIKTPSEIIPTSRPGVIVKDILRSLSKTNKNLPDVRQKIVAILNKYIEKLKELFTTKAHLYIQENQLTIDSICGQIKAKICEQNEEGWNNSVFTLKTLMENKKLFITDNHVNLPFFQEGTSKEKENLENLFRILKSILELDEKILNDFCKNLKTHSDLNTRLEKKGSTIRKKKKSTTKDEKNSKGQHEIQETVKLLNFFNFFNDTYFNLITDRIYKTYKELNKDYRPKIFNSFLEKNFYISKKQEELTLTFIESGYFPNKNFLININIIFTLPSTLDYDRLKVDIHISGDKKDGGSISPSEDCSYINLMETIELMNRISPSMWSSDLIE